jgi:lysozyme
MSWEGSGNDPGKGWINWLIWASERYFTLKFPHREAPVVPPVIPAVVILIQDDERLELYSYKDPGGVWTIGYGHTGADVKPWSHITRQQAEKLFEHDLFTFQSMTHAQIHDVPTTPEQYSAMVSLCYNIGIYAFKKSSVLRFHRNHQYSSAGNAFLLFDKERIDDKLIASEGLLRRRQQERRIYLGA